jgi:hypothetical protein
VFEDVHVHHADGDHANDAIENLFASHTGCHAKYHRSKQVFGPAALAKRSASLRRAYTEGRKSISPAIYSATAKAAKSAAMKRKYEEGYAPTAGRVVGAEERARRSAAQMESWAEGRRSRVKSSEHRGKIAATVRQRHAEGVYAK